MSEGRRTDLQVSDVGRKKAVDLQQIEDELVVFDDSTRLDDACGEDAVRPGDGQVVGRQNVAKNGPIFGRRIRYAAWARDLPEVDVRLDDRVRVSGRFQVEQRVVHCAMVAVVCGDAHRNAL